MKRRSLLQALAALLGVASVPRELAPVSPEPLQECATVKFEKHGTYLLIYRLGGLTDSAREDVLRWLWRSGVNAAALGCESGEFEEAIRLYRF